MRAAAFRGEREFEALQAALETMRPVCRDDARYIADPDDVDEADIAELEAGCDLCHVRALCAAYATVARPQGGFWAGRHWETTK